MSSASIKPSSCMTTTSSPACGFTVRPSPSLLRIKSWPGIFFTKLTCQSFWLMLESANYDKAVPLIVIFHDPCVFIPSKLHPANTRRPEMMGIHHPITNKLELHNCWLVCTFTVYLLMMLTLPGGCCQRVHFMGDSEELCHYRRKHPETHQ